MLRFAAATVSNTPVYSFWTRTLPSQQHHRLRWASRRAGKRGRPTCRCPARRRMPNRPPPAPSHHPTVDAPRGRGPMVVFAAPRCGDVACPLTCPRRRTSYFSNRLLKYTWHGNTSDRLARRGGMAGAWLAVRLRWHRGQDPTSLPKTVQPGCGLQMPPRVFILGRVCGWRAERHRLMNSSGAAPCTASIPESGAPADLLGTIEPSRAIQLTVST